MLKRLILAVLVLSCLSIPAITDTAKPETANRCAVSGRVTCPYDNMPCFFERFDIGPGGVIAVYKCSYCGREYAERE